MKRSVTMTPLPIDKVLRDQALLGTALGDLSTWKTWVVALRAAFALPLDDGERAIFASIAGGRGVPERRVRELWCVCGRRSGKSRMAAALSVYFACFVEHKLVPGEVGMVLTIANTVDQARVVLTYVKGFLESSPILRGEVESINAQEVTLKNGIVIACHSNSFRSVRGRTLIAAVFDETSFWKDDASATPDIETYRAVRPSFLTSKGMLIGISTPYRKAGLLYTKHRDHFGIDGDILCVQGASRTFNPSLDEAEIEAERALDPEMARGELDAEFRSDLSSLLGELIDAAVDHARPLELPPRPGVRYFAYADPSGGGADAYTFAICHVEEAALLIVDLVRGASGKIDPVAVTGEFAFLAKQYGVATVTGDRYGAGWVVGAWSACGIRYEHSELAKSDIYLEVLASFARGLVRLPDHAKLLRELRLLERQTHRSGKDTVDHPRNGHDDYANAVCGAIIAALHPRGVVISPEFLARARAMPPTRADAYLRPSGFAGRGGRVVDSGAWGFQVKFGDC
jgi:hypothetical protein